jgi:aryl-alcohol dehydrogenase-like predicted oxidoreductase
MLKTSILGRTGLEVTNLGFGAMELKGVVEDGGRLPNEEHAGVVLNAVLDSGINFIDTSWCYDRSEEFIGRFVSHRREEYVLATKCGHWWRNDPDHSGWSHEGMMNSINQSLERLKTDHVDILQLHNSTPDDVRTHDSINTLKEIQAQGKTRFIGISTVLPYIEEFMEMGIFDTFQIPYSAMEPEHEDVIRRAAEMGIGTIIRGGVALGTPDLEGAAKRQTGPKVKDRWETADLSSLAPEIDPMEMMLRFTTSHPHINSIIAGTQSLEHIAENISVIQKGGLDTDLVRKIKDRVASVID